MTLPEVLRLKRQLVTELRTRGTIGVGELQSRDMLIGWAAIMGLGALIFWATLQPPKRA